jgi:hypothetical protein
LGTTQTYTADGITITAAGFTSTAALTAGSANANLFGKNLGGDESGLGLVDDPSGQGEITGTNLIRIAMAPGVTISVQFAMNSTTAGQPEGWLVEGSNLATSGFAPLLMGNDELSHPLASFNFYAFSATAGNVLLASISAVPGPIVGAGLPGLVAACGALLALVRRRRQQIA